MCDLCDPFPDQRDRRGAVFCLCRVNVYVRKSGRRAEELGLGSERRDFICTKPCCLYNRINISDEIV